MCSLSSAPKTESEVTMMMNSTSAPEKALGVNKLLENILSHLPMKDLIHAQSVCKQWRAVIDGSKVLGQHLFLENKAVDLKPLRRCTSMACLGSDHHMVYHFPEQDLHPLLPRSGYISPSSRINFSMEYDDVMCMRSWRSSWPSGQWKDMFAVQPPATSATIEVLSLGDKEQVEITNPAGIRLGDIVGAFHDEHVATEVWVDFPDVYETQRQKVHELRKCEQAKSRYGQLLVYYSK